MFESLVGHRTALWLALTINFAMFIYEYGAAENSNSIALRADSFDFFCDAISIFITLVVIGMSQQTRSIAALIKASMMSLAGVMVLLDFIKKLINGHAPDSSVIFNVACLAFFANFLVVTLLVNFKQKDSNNHSIWLCSLNDCFANGLVILSAWIMVYSDQNWLDLAVGLIIAVMLIHSSLRIFKMAFIELSIENQLFSNKKS